MPAAGNNELPDSLSEIMDFSSYDLFTTLRLIVLSGETRSVDVRRGSKQRLGLYKRRRNLRSRY